MKDDNYELNTDNKKDSLIILLFLVMIVTYCFYSAYYYSQQPKYTVECGSGLDKETLKTDNYSEAFAFAKQCENKLGLGKPAWEKEINLNYSTES